MRIKWWPKKGIAGEMVNAKLTSAQFTQASAYLVLWLYALPKLTNWVNDDRFMHMITFYRARYGEELDAILKDGVEYDTDGDSTVQDDEKIATDASRLDR